MKRRVPAWLWVPALVLAAGLVNYLDRDTLFLEQARYCHMVAMGYWPDFDNSFAQACQADGKVKGDDRDPFAEAQH